MTRTRTRLLLSASLLLGACFDYDDSTAGDDGVEDTAADTGTDDTGAEDTTADGSGETDTTPADPCAPAYTAPELPTYEDVSCADRTPAAVNPDVGMVTVNTPACGYEVRYPQGIVDVVESCGGATDVPEGLHLTIPTLDASTSMAVLWTTPDSTRQSMVRVGLSPDNLDQVYWGHSFTYALLDDRVAHEVHLCGLQPGTTYYYQAGGEGAWSDVYSFVTAPTIACDDEIVFAVAGDSRSDTFEIWGDAVAQMVDLGAEFIVFSGDAVEAGPVQAQWDGFFSQGQPGMASLPFIPANGNHDLLVSPWYGQFALPEDEVNFTVRYGPLAFVSMTDFYPLNVYAIEGEFAEYLDAAFESQSDALWKFLVNHRPFYSASTRHGSAEDLVPAWGPIMDRHNVDIVFNGHDHNYERSRPIRDDEIATDGNGTIYTVVAGVGAPLYENGSQWWTEHSEKVESFAIVRVTPDELQFTAYRIDGSVLDTLTLER